MHEIQGYHQLCKVTAVPEWLQSKSSTSHGSGINVITGVIPSSWLCSFLRLRGSLYIHFIELIPFCPSKATHYSTMQVC
jgi:hypothetical protein